MNLGVTMKFELNLTILKRFLQEYEIINNLDRPNIIHAFGFCFGDSTHQETDDN